ncbi:MAG: hypothetical protein MRZ37_00895 [Tenericutes bacterium]|nr:hypothetical protein [Mycoplasmatota bacterium]
MNLIDTINEIGIFETNLQLEKYVNNKSLMHDISKYIPISLNALSKQQVDDAIVKILNLQKRNIMLLSNEISILENLLNYKKCFDNIIVVLSGNLNKEQKENIIKNSPDKNFIKYISELEYPSLIKPKNSVIITFGYRNGNKCLLTKNSYRTMEIYNDFFGEKIFISCSQENINERPKNWVSINSEKYFTKVF